MNPDEITAVNDGRPVVFRNATVLTMDGAGVINGSDYTLIDNAFNTQRARLTTELADSTAEIAGNISAVPEPGSVSLLCVGIAAILSRRRNYPSPSSRTIGAASSINSGNRPTSGFAKTLS